MGLLLYLDQNYLSGMVKRKPAFRELEPVLRAAVARGEVAVPEAEAHRLESSARPDLPLLELLGELSGGLRLGEPGAVEWRNERRLAAALERHFPAREARASDAVDLRALALALPRCRLVTCDAFMADVVRRTGLELRYGCVHRAPGGRRAPQAAPGAAPALKDDLQLRRLPGDSCIYYRPHGNPYAAARGS